MKNFSLDMKRTTGESGSPDLSMKMSKKPMQKQAALGEKDLGNVLNKGTRGKIGMSVMDQVNTRAGSDSVSADGFSSSGPGDMKMTKHNPTGAVKSINVQNVDDSYGYQGQKNNHPQGGSSYDDYSGSNYQDPINNNNQQYGQNNIQNNNQNNFQNNNQFNNQNNFQNNNQFNQNNNYNQNVNQNSMHGNQNQQFAQQNNNLDRNWAQTDPQLIRLLEPLVQKITLSNKGFTQFFLPFIVHNTRQYDLWELEVIFGQSVDRYSWQQLSQLNCGENPQVNQGQITYMWLWDKIVNKTNFFMSDRGQNVNQSSRYLRKPADQYVMPVLQSIAAEMQRLQIDARGFYEQRFNGLSAKPNSQNFQQGISSIVNLNMDLLERVMKYFNGVGGSDLINAMQFKEGMLPIQSGNFNNYNNQNQQQQPMHQPSGGDYLDDAIPILTRIGNHMELNSLQIGAYFGGNFKQINQMKCLTQTEFMNDLAASKLRLSQQEAQCLAKNFEVNNLVSINLMEERVRGIQASIQRLVQTNQRQFLEITHAIRNLNSGVYDFFQSCCQRNQQGVFVINKNCWEQAMQKLRPNLQQNEVQNLFNDIININLSANKYGVQTEITINQIEELLRGANRQKKGNSFQRKQAMDMVMMKISGAYNHDVMQIQQSMMNASRKLAQNQQSSKVTQKDFIGFFRNKANMPQSYSDADIMDLVDEYTLKGEIDYQIFIQDLEDATKTMQINRPFQTQIVPGNPGNQSNNAFMPGFNGDGTKNTADKLFKNRPHDFRDNLEASLIEGLQKGVFFKKTTIQDHFGNYTQSSYERHLMEGNWSTAVQALGLQWDRNTMLSVFQSIDRALHDNQARNSVTAQDIDDYVYFAKKNTIEQLHDNQQLDVAQSLRQRNIMPEQLFQQQVKMNKNVIRPRDLQEIMVGRGPLGLNWTDLDFQFYVAKYLSPQNQNEIFFNKIIDDVKNKMAQGGQNVAPGAKFGQASKPDQVLAVIQKAIIAYEQNLQYLFSSFRDQKMSQQAFLNTWKSRNFNNMVPEEVSHEALVACFQFIDKRNLQEISFQQLDSAIRDQTPQEQNLKQEVLRLMSPQIGAIKQEFRQNEFYQDQAILKDAFIQIMTKPSIGLSSLNSHFLAQEYRATSGNYVSHKRLLTELESMGGVEIVGGMGRMPGGITSHQELLKNNTAILKKLAQKLSGNKKNVGQLFQNYLQQDRFTQQMTLSVQDFTQALNQFLNLNNNELQNLSTTYRMQNNPQCIDHLRFCEQLQELEEPNLPNLNQDQTRAYNQYKKNIDNENLLNDLVFMLREADNLANPSGYIDGNNLASVLQDVFFITVEKNQRAIKTNVSAKDVQNIMSPLPKHVHQKHKYYWKQMIHQMWSFDICTQLFTCPAEKLRAVGPQAAVTSITKVPDQPKKFSSNETGELCRKLIQVAQQGQGANIEEVLIRCTQSSEQGNPGVYQSQITDAIQECGIQMNQTERRAVDQWIARATNNNRQAMINPIDFLGQCLGWEPSAIKSRFAKQVKKVLNRDELERCKRDLISVGKSLNQNNRSFNEFSRFLDYNTDSCMGPQQFFNALKALVPTVFSSIKPRVSNLIHYLVKEEPGRVSLAKLKQATLANERNAPLEQEGAEEAKKYLREIQQSESLSIMHLLAYMHNHTPKLEIDNLFQIGSTNQKQTIPTQDFLRILSEVHYQFDDKNELIRDLAQDSSKQQISIRKLKSISLAKYPTGGSMNTKKQYGNLSKDIQQKIARISDHCKKQGWTVAQLHSILDTNNDKVVSKQEFCDKAREFSMTQKDFANIYDAIDLKHSGQLSVDEISLFIDGAKASRQQQVSSITDQMNYEITQDITKLFEAFDHDRDQEISAKEIFKTMQSMGYDLDLAEAERMIASKSAKKTLGPQEFHSLMQPIMLDHIFSSENQVEEFRSFFKAADYNYNGFLTIDEIYCVLVKNGFTVQKEELAGLMLAFDVDKDMKLDINEFVAMMTESDMTDIEDPKARNTFFKLKRSRQLNAGDFLRAFGDMPMTFSVSFYKNAWVKMGRNLPSEGLRVQIDPQTMLWKDLLAWNTESLKKDNQSLKKDEIPEIRPIQSSDESEITLIESENVPLPTGAKDFDPDKIYKRIVRVGLYDKSHGKLLFNCAQVPAQADPKKLGRWDMGNKSSAFKNPLNPVIFRTTEADDLDKKEVCFIFEHVLCVKKGSKTQEYCCGWAILPLDSAMKGGPHKLEINGGTPVRKMALGEQSFKQSNSIIDSVKNLIGSKGTNKPTMSINIKKQLEPYQRYHLTHMPSTVILNNKLLSFVSGFRNYAIQHLNRQQSQGRRPDGDITISTFPKIMDSIDVVEEFAAIYAEDYWDSRSVNVRKQITPITEKAVEYIGKLYPVLYADEFDWRADNFTDASYNADSKDKDQTQLLKKRKELINSALRYDGQKRGNQKPIEQLAHFKPFSIKELDWEIFDTQDQKKPGMHYEDGNDQSFDEGGLHDSSYDDMNNARFPPQQPAFAQAKSHAPGFQQRNF